MNDMKPFWESRTVWLNVCTLLVATLTALLGTDLVRQNPETASWLAAAVAVSNVFLRFITTQPIVRPSATNDIDEYDL